MKRRDIRLVALVSLIVLQSACTADAAAHDDSLSRGAKWLLREQAADGGWHSTTYGQMTSGVGNSALVLDALTQMLPTWQAEHRPAIDRGIGFLLANLADEVYVSAPRHSADYPIYATAILLRVLDRLETDKWGDERRRMREYLFSVQRQSGKGDPVAGGWPQVGGERDDALAEVNVNVSVTRSAIEALQPALSENHASKQAALQFLVRCQSAKDGGFCFIPPVDDPLNKAGVADDGTPRSYGSATADGLAALLVCGLPPDDARVRKALAWLESHASLDAVPGISDDENSFRTAREALRFYYYASPAHVIELLPNSQLADRRDATRAQLTSLQRPDGSWSNPVALMRENDPHIATSLAVSALATLQAATPK